MTAKKTAAAKPEAPEGRVLKAGTVLRMHDNDVTLEKDTVVTYPNSASEAGFVGLLHLSSTRDVDNLAINRETLKFRYDGFGTLQPLAEQVDDPDDMPKFIKGLTLEEALGFGIDEALWNDYQK